MGRPHLPSEYRIMELVKNPKYIPNVLYLEEQPMRNVMIMQLKGPNLSDLFHLIGRHLNTRTAAHIMHSMVGILQHVHSKGILHRDMKPENITVGKWPGDAHNIYLIDFG